MLAYTYLAPGALSTAGQAKAALRARSRSSIVRVTLSSICTSDLHIQARLCAPGRARGSP